MAARVSAFKTAQHRTAYEQVYDRLLRDHWPVARDELDIDTRFGPTRVRRSHGGDGVPLVMLHPHAGSSVGWYPLIEHLVEDRDVYTPDTMGGCGRTVQEQPVTAAQDLVDWVDELLDQLGHDRVHLLGYSEGGWVAANVAATSRNAGRLASVTLVEPAAAIAKVPAGFLLQMVGRGMLAMASRDRTAGIARLNRWMNGDVELTDVQLELLEVSLGTFTQRLPKPAPLTDDDLAAITAPVLLMIAEDTKLYDPDVAARRARELIADVTIDITANAGHGLLFQYPDTTIARINTFLRQHH